jgi:hypothetical protein
VTAVEIAAPAEHHDAAPTTVRLAALTRYEMRRYARHPLFPLGVGLTALTCYLYLHTTVTDPGSPSGYSSLFLGVFGIVIGFRLTQSTQNAVEVLDVAPATPQLRTGALCLAALVPFVVGALTLAAILIFQHPAGAWIYGTFGPSDRFAMLAGQVPVVALGGPLVGIVAARWIRFAGALPVLVVLLAVWVVVVNTVAATYRNPLAPVLLRMLTPYAYFLTLDHQPRQVETWRGSPWFFLGWQLCLCALAVTVALRRGAGPRWRRPLQAIMAAVGLAAVAMYLLAATGGLDHTILTRPDGTIIPL